MKTATGRVALACAVDGIPSAERQAHFTLLNQLFGDLAVERETLSNGYGYRFEAGLFERVIDFVRNERKCCPFLTFAIELGASGGPLWLRIHGPEGTREFLDVELPQLGRGASGPPPP
jgi:hypothetical protein